MQPILARGSRLAVYVLACLVLGGLLSAVLARHGSMSIWQAAVVVLPLVTVYGFVCLSSWYVCRATPVKTSRSVAVVGNLAGATLVATLMWLALARGLARGAARAWNLTAIGGVVAEETLLLFTVGALLYLLAIAAHYVIINAEEARASEQRTLEVQLLAREAELKALRAQIEPHFLFNSLNSISALTTSDPAGARRMCVLLGEFLRASLKMGSHERIPFSEELALTARFFEIEQVRFGARLAFAPTVADEVAACLVPPLLLQPLAENAVGHGIAGLLEGGTVRLEATRADGALRITLENPFDADARRARTGVGLANVRRRLATEYGHQAALTVTDHDGCFRATITLPVTLQKT
ncbi:MAG: sensor histidine kinase [Bacteroidales bacterium]